MSSLKGVYQNFLASPNAGALHDDASLNYITTLTTIRPAPAVVKHFAAHEKVLKRKEEKALDAIESDNALYLEVETTLEFLSSGGAYLPGLDDNFLADHVVIFPIIHIVHFDESQKIQSIRLSWDQGSLLKQIDVIGARARSWPIRDGKDQARLVASTAATALPSQGSVKPAHGASNGASKQPEPTEASNGARPRNNTNVTRDPHASLALFSAREEPEIEEPKRSSKPPSRGFAGPPPRDYGDIFAGSENEASRLVSPRKENTVAKAQSAKPPPRDYHDLFAGGEEDVSPASKGKPSSPLKNITSPGAPKAGAGKNFQPMRLFENIGEGMPYATPKDGEHKSMKSHPEKYNHFEFGQNDDGKGSEQEQQPLASRPKSSKDQSQWGFEDFMTPNKVPQKKREQDQRHFGWSDDEPNMDSPAKPAPPKARPDANPHFDFVDDGSSAGRPTGQSRGPGGRAKGGVGLYQNDIFGGEEDAAERASRPLSTVTNLKDRRKEFESHFGMTDASPNNGPAKQFPGHKSAAIQTMSANWTASDESPAPAHSDRSSSNHPFGSTHAAGKENIGIKSAGDGMGGRKGGAATASAQNMGIKSGGDGMGGKKGNGRSWGFGDDSDGEEVGGRNTGAFRAQRRQQAPAETSHWDF